MSNPDSLCWMPKDDGGFFACTKHGTWVGELYVEVDGYYVFAPARGNKGGYWPQWMLEDIVAKLKEVNRKWDEGVTTELTRLESLNGTTTTEVVNGL